jgi:hypothetical protein
MPLKLITSILFGFFTFSAMGQIKYGVTGGVNRSTIVTNDIPNYYITGFDVGVTSEMSISDHFFLSPQILYMTRGRATSESSMVRLQYLSLPVLAGYKINHHFEVLAGPTFGYLLSVYPSIFKGLIRSSDLGICGTIRYRINSRSGIDLSYLYSLFGVYEHYHVVDMQTYVLPEKANNQSFQISFFYLFR